MNLRLFQRLQSEPGLDHRSLILSFPSQIASLEQPLTEFLQTAFAATGDEKALRLRGAYLTCGTQEGTPIDRLLGVMTRSFGLNPRAVPSVRPGQARSYFLTLLLRAVIFGEAMLVSRNPAAMRRHARIRAIAFAGAAIPLAAAGALLWLIQSSEQRPIDTAARALKRYELAAARLPLNPVNDADLLGLLPWLNQAAAMRSAADATAAAPPWWKLRLSQEVKLSAATHEIYRHALDRALLPRLMWRLEAQLRGNRNKPEFLYAVTGVYLMPGNAGPLDRDPVDEWMKLDWERLYPGDDLAPVRTELLRHLDALLAEPRPAASLDGDLVVRARKAFGGVSLAERAYSRLRLSVAARHLPSWRPSDALGAAGVGLFVRAGANHSMMACRGFSPRTGFTACCFPCSMCQRKAWYRRAGCSGGQLRLATPAATSARVTLVRAQPSPSPTPHIPTPHIESAAARLQDEPGAASADNSTTAAPGHEIDERYQALLRFIGNGPDPPLARMLKSLIDIRQLLAKLAAAPVGSSLPHFAAGSNPAVSLQTAADRLPQPAARWFSSIAASSAALPGGKARGQVGAVYNAPGGPAVACAAVIASHYPFVRGPQNDVSRADLAGLFAPGGQVDGFVNTLSRPYIDMTGPVWRPQPADGVPAPVSAADLAQLQRAAEIRDAFFPAGGTIPSIRFDSAPLSIDRASVEATPGLDGTEIIASHDPSRSTEITWPSQATTSTARLVFDPPLSGHPDGLSNTGPWSLLRLFTHGTLRPGTAPGRYRLAFQAGKRAAIFEIRLGAGPNPFSLDPLQGFRRPMLSGT